MGCTSCSSGGLPAGCKNNGACGVSGCNKLEVFDWLAGMELPNGQRPFDIIEVRFKNSRKAFYRCPSDLELHIGEVIAVEASPGHDIGVVSLTGELVKFQLRKKGVRDNSEIRKVYRKAHEEDLSKWQEARQLEQDTMLKARKISADNGLVMKISDVEYQGDKSRATFYYTAEDRVDFRELIRHFADAFKVRIEMRQIGSRQEASRLGGIGTCGRELCCSTWLTDFRSVSTSAARYQQLALNPQKLAGQCGKLKCCLNYELDSYAEAVRDFPAPNTKLFTELGPAVQFKTDIFKKMVWFIYEDYRAGSSPIGLSLSAVNEIIELNKQNKKPKDLKDFLIQVEEEEEEEFYSNVVGQDSLNRFDTKPKKKKRKKPAQRTVADTGVTQQTPNPQNRDSGPDNRPPRNPEAGAALQGPKPQGQPGGSRPQGQRPQPAPGPKQQNQNPGQNPHEPRPPRPPRDEQGPNPQGPKSQEQHPTGPRPNRPNRNRGRRPDNTNDNQPAS